jgi:hypothetical protein
LTKFADLESTNFRNFSAQDEAAKFITTPAESTIENFLRALRLAKAWVAKYPTAFALIMIVNSRLFFATSYRQRLPAD